MITVIVAGLIDSWLGVCVGWFAASLMAVASMADDDVAPPKADAVGLPDLAERGRTPKAQRHASGSDHYQTTRKRLRD